jgi:hypothetical protein
LLTSSLLLTERRKNRQNFRTILIAVRSDLLAALLAPSGMAFGAGGKSVNGLRL